MNVPIIELFTIAISVIVFMIYKLHKHSQECKLRDLVAWCVTDDSHKYRCNLHLHDYVHSAQIENKLLQEYRIASEDEWKLAKEILKEFQRELAQDYFCGNLKIIKSKYVVRGKDYFMFALFSFLTDHQCDYTFIGYDMRNTVFGVVYYKMYYIAYVFCENSSILNPKRANFLYCNNIKETLDAKITEVLSGD